MDQELLRVAHRAVQEAESRGDSHLSTTGWALSRIRSILPNTSGEDARKAVRDILDTR